MVSGLRGEALDRALGLLELLGNDGAPIPLAALSRRSGVPKSTVHRLLGVLVAREIVAREELGYVLGRRLLQITTITDARSTRPVRRLALPYLVDLYLTVGGVVSLGTLHHNNLLYLDRVSGQAHATISSRVASRTPLHCTAIGKLLLAYQDRVERPVFVGNGVVSTTRRTLTRGSAFERELILIRKFGVVFVRAEHSRLTSVAAPVFGRSGRLVAALDFSNRAGTFDEKTVSEQVRRNACVLSVLVRRAGIETTRHLVDQY